MYPCLSKVPHTASHGCPSTSPGSLAPQVPNPTHPNLHLVFFWHPMSGRSCTTVLLIFLSLVSCQWDFRDRSRLFSSSVPLPFCLLIAATPPCPSFSFGFVSESRIAQPTLSCLLDTDWPIRPSSNCNFFRTAEMIAF